MQFQSSIVASVQSITLFLVKLDREALFLLISRDKASSTMMQRSGLSTEPWCTPNFTSNLSLRPFQTLTQLRTFSYIPSSFTIHSSTLSFLIADQIIFYGTWSDAFSRSTKAISICLPTVRNFSCSWQMTKIASVVPTAWEEPKLLFVNSHHLPNEAVGNSLNDFHSLLRQFLSCKVASVHSISPFPL